MILFAQETVTEAPTFPPYFWIMLVAVVIVSLLGMLIQAIGWRVIDKITPGKLDEEILGTATKQPNVALAIVVAGMFIGLSLIVAFTIHGVLTH